ncbi:MAG: phosphatase PAP2 family protein [Chloroflexi bacterium]|nr:phosphatase PAP2 family protein [Chloroflexota bacterium]
MERSDTISSRLGRYVSAHRLAAFCYTLCLLLFVALAFAAAMHDRLPGDLTLSLRLQGVHGKLFGDAMRTISFMGNDALLAAEVLLLAGGLWISRWRRASVLVLLTLVADGISYIVKELVSRPRPSAYLVRVTGSESTPSFPSGHAVHFVVIFGLLAFLVPRLFGRGMFVRALQGLLLLLIPFVGISRVYLGVHWTSDVLGGYLLGILILWPLAASWKEKNDANREAKKPTPIARRR